MKVRKVNLKPGEQIQIVVEGYDVVLVGFDPSRNDNRHIAIGMQGDDAKSDFGFWFGCGSLRALLKQQNED